MIWKKLLAVKVSLVVAILSVCLVNATDRIHERSLEVNYLKQQVEQAKVMEQRLMGMECRDLRVIKVNVTSYNPTKKQGWKDGMKTADGNLPTPGVIAISRDLEKKHGIKFGDKVMVEGYGTFTVADYMNPRWKNRVDIISFIPKWSSKFGCKQGVNLYFNAVQTKTERTNHE